MYSGGFYHKNFPKCGKVKRNLITNNLIFLKSIYMKVFVVNMENCRTITFALIIVDLGLLELSYCIKILV